MSRQIKETTEEESNILRLSERCVQLIKPAIERLGRRVAGDPFDSSDVEIAFFKEIKPHFNEELIYYLNLYRIENRRPIGTAQSQIIYIEEEMRKLDESLVEHGEFYRYYRNGASFLDDYYFTRGIKDIRFLMEMDWLQTEDELTTGYDYLLAKMFAFERLINYLEKELRRLKGGLISEEPRKTEGIQEENVISTKFVQTPYRGAEIYVILKAFIDSQAIVNHTYKSFFELVGPGISNMQQKSFVPASLLKYSDKVDPETRENAKRLLQKMIRNIDSY